MPAKLRGAEGGGGRPGRRLQFQPPLKRVVETPVKLERLKRMGMDPIKKTPQREVRKITKKLVLFFCQIFFHAYGNFFFSFIVLYFFF